MKIFDKILIVWLAELKTCLALKLELSHGIRLLRAAVLGFVGTRSRQI